MERKWAILKNNNPTTIEKSNSYRIKSWSHLGLNQGLPDYESGALTN